MTKTRSTKRALIMNGLALLMCVSMLIGSTFAWFTDTVTSKGNIIKSGALDVEMYWAKGTEVPDSANWIDASTGAIFDDDHLWEPGYTEVRHIKIENKGSLALKYQISIAANGEVTDLTDVIDVYYLDPAQQVGDRTKLTADMRLGTLTQVLGDINTTASGDLEPKQSHTITLALKMQEEAGDTYQGKSIGTDFSVKLAATQKDFESDSFGKDYDAGLEPEEEDGMYRTLADGSIVFYYNEASGFGGRVRLVGLPENIGSEYVVPAEVNDLGGKLVGATLDKLTVPAGIAYGYKSLEGATIKEVVIEDGATTVPNRLFYKANVESVVIPNSVTTFEESAFQQVYMKELVIPANVENFGYQAFGGSTLEKITFEGKNLVFENRVMRECGNLRTVVFNCDDITFKNSSSYGDCWISNKGANGNGYSNITFYVKNETVEGKLRTAIIHENIETTPIYVNGKLTVKVENADQLVSKLNSATPGTVIDATGVTFDINSLGTDTGSGIMAYNIPGGVTIKNLSVVGAYRGGNYLIFEGEPNQEIVFENCTFEPSGRAMGLGFCGSEGASTSVVYNDCTFKGPVITNFVDNTDGVAKFNNCTFKKHTSGNNYVMAMGGTHIFNGCTFDYTGVAQTNMGTVNDGCINSVSDSDGSYSTAVILNGCTRTNCGTRSYGPNSSLVVE